MTKNNNLCKPARRFFFYCDTFLNDTLCEITGSLSKYNGEGMENVY